MSAQIPPQRMLLEDASFVIVDTETTGGRASEDRVIEIGAVRLRGGELTDQFQQLVNPECAVPRRITRLTGISSSMVFDQPTIRDVLPGFLDFLGSDVVVAHNLLFDMRVLNAECRRIGRSEIANESLCTVRLARRLLPGLRSKGLDSVTDFLGIRNRRHHRALPDAEATAKVLQRFLDQVELEFGLRRLKELLGFQYRRYRALGRASRHVTWIRDHVLAELPTGPGVYFFKDGGGRTMYVGKARNLQRRVRSYFTSIEGHPPRIRKLVRSVREVDWRSADSELEALMLESRLIKEMQPAYNRAQRRYVNRPFIRIGTDHRYPRVTASAFVHDDGAEYYGPLAGRDEARFVAELIDRFFQLRECRDEELAKARRCVYASMGRCTAPCESASTADRADYADEVDRVRAFLLGQDDSVLERIEAAMRSSSAELDYEQAGVYRDWLRRVERMLGKREMIASRVLAHNAVIVHAAEGRAVRLLVVCRGRHVQTLVGRESAGRLQAVLEKHFVNGDGPDVYRQREVDELHLLSNWLYAHRNEVRQVHWHEGRSISELVGQVRSELERCASPDAVV